MHEPSLPGLGRTTVNFTTLREANVARQKEWDPSNVVDFSWRCNELAGEAGEVCNILKKLHREKHGLPGSRAVKDDLAEELADVVICVDLVAMTAGIEPVGERVTPMVPFDTLTDAGNGLAARVGAISSLVFQGGQDAADGKVNPQTLTERLRLVVQTANTIARMEGIDLLTAVAMKFNSTSHKVGLSTRLRYTDD